MLLQACVHLTSPRRYEFLVGITPFYGESIEEIFQNILACEIKWPEPPDDPLSESAMDLISRLLTVNPLERVGANGIVLRC
jgi:serine/threonine protein kinase